MEQDRPVHPSLLRLYEVAGVSTPTALAELLNESQQTINNWSARGVSKQGAIKASEKLKDCDVNFILNGGNKPSSAPNLVMHSFQKKADGLLTINQYNDVGGAMGMGVLLQDQPGQITSWEVTSEWLAKNIPSNTGAANLKIITGFGNSMQGMYNPGDPLVIDIGVNECNHDGVFFFRVGNEGFVKTLQRIPGEGIRVKSKNPDYESWTIKPDMDFQVLGKVLKVWKSDLF